MSIAFSTTESVSKAPVLTGTAMQDSVPATVFVSPSTEDGLRMKNTKNGRLADYEYIFIHAKS